MSDVTKGKSVPEALAALGDIYRERNKTYGDNYKHFGQTMIGMFPNGITLKTVDDFNRFGVFIQTVSKITRYAHGWKVHHPDTMNDTTVYSQMQRELDEEAFARKEEKESSVDVPKAVRATLNLLKATSRRLKITTEMHLHFSEMEATIETNKDIWSEGKLNRWLGYIQGVAEHSGALTLEELKQINKHNQKEKK
jgi:hypothetical protein